jgi:hypothetical protein
MKAFKIIIVLFLIVVIAIQFIKPKPNLSEGISSSDISTAIQVPHDVETILRNACYDCHSNNTAYPWYSHVQPVGWLLSRHIREGKKELNFSEFASYNQKKQSDRLKEMTETIEENDMPIFSYRMMHKNARLNEQQKKLLTDWIAKIQNPGMKQ